jgi:hypothetical protein
MTYDRISIDSRGDNPAGHNARVYRNGVLIPGLRNFEVAGDVTGAITFTSTQIVTLGTDHEDLVEEAVQALEEREAAWAADDEPG